MSVIDIDRYREYATVILGRFDGSGPIQIHDVRNLANMVLELTNELYARDQPAPASTAEQQEAGQS